MKIRLARYHEMAGRNVQHHSTEHDVGLLSQLSRLEEELTFIAPVGLAAGYGRLRECWRATTSIGHTLRTTVGQAGTLSHAVHPRFRPADAKHERTRLCGRGTRSCVGEGGGVGRVWTILNWEAIGLKWTEDAELESVENALDQVFGGLPCLLLAHDLFEWVKELLPYRCGVRRGKKRLSFLVGQYRPAAIKRQGKSLRLDMVFAHRLPPLFSLTDYQLRTVRVLEGAFSPVQQVPLPLSPDDIDRFRTACQMVREAANEASSWTCNVLVKWPYAKPMP